MSLVAGTGYPDTILKANVMPYCVQTNEVQRGMYLSRTQGMCQSEAAIQ